MVELRRQPVTIVQEEETRSQRLISSLFGGGGKMWGVNNNPVNINQTLTSGEGLIKGTERLSDQDPTGETKSFFGF